MRCGSDSRFMFAPLLPALPPRNTSAERAPPVPSSAWSRSQTQGTCQRCRLLLRLLLRFFLVSLLGAFIHPLSSLVNEPERSAQSCPDLQQTCAGMPGRHGARRAVGSVASAPWFAPGLLTGAVGSAEAALQAHPCPVSFGHCSENLGTEFF